MKKKGLGIAILVTGLMLAGCGQKEAVEKKKTTSVKKEIIVGTSADYEPYEFKDEDGNIVGFDIDIAKSIAEEKGYTVSFKDIIFDDLLTELNEGKVDVVIAAMSPTEERKKLVQFSDSYYTARDYLVFKDGNYTTLQDFEGKKIGVQSGSTQEEYLKRMNGHIDYKIVAMTTIPSIYEALKTHKVDGILVEDNVAKKTILDEHWSWTEVGNGEATTYALAFAKDSAYYEDFNDGITQLKLNGKLDDIIEKWIEQ